MASLAVVVAVALPAVVVGFVVVDATTVGFEFGFGFGVAADAAGAAATVTAAEAGGLATAADVVDVDEGGIGETFRLQRPLVPP